MHMLSYIVFLALVFPISNRVANSHFQKFLRALCIHSLWLLIPGFLNFSPTTGVIASTFGVIIFSTVIVHGFIELNVNTKSNYYELMERQKKMDYTGNLAGSLIHEVNNTNQIIKGFSKILSESADITERDKNTLEMIQKSSEHLEGLADNYKAYMKSSEMKNKKEDLEVIIQEAIDFSSEMLREKKVNIHFENNYDYLYAYINIANLEQVFINLIKNSIEAMPENKEQKEITIKTEIENETIIIHFIDNGKGISPSDWENIFDPFVSFSKTGMGFGLPFVKKTIIEHFGDIRIENSSDQGTHFRIEIPQNGILNNH